jgi:hypothetical protein
MRCKNNLLNRKSSVCQYAQIGCVGSGVLYTFTLRVCWSEGDCFAHLAAHSSNAGLEPGVQCHWP